MDCHYESHGLLDFEGTAENQKTANRIDLLFVL